MAVASSAADRRSVTPAMPMSQAMCRRKSASPSPSVPSFCGMARPAWSARNKKSDSRAGTAPAPAPVRRIQQCGHGATLSTALCRRQRRMLSEPCRGSSQNFELAGNARQRRPHPDRLWASSGAGGSVAEPHPAAIVVADLIHSAHAAMPLRRARDSAVAATCSTSTAARPCGAAPQSTVSAASIRAAVPGAAPAGRAAGWPPAHCWPGPRRGVPASPHPAKPRPESP